MSLEAIVTDVDVDSITDCIDVTLWKYGTIRIPLDTFPFRSEHIPEQQLEEMENAVKEFSGRHGYEYMVVRSMRSKRNPDGKPNITLKAPPSAAKQFPERLGKKFFAGHYTEYVREEYIKPGDVITIDDHLVSVLAGIKTYNQAQDDVKDVIREYDRKSSQKTITRRYNELQSIMREQDPIPDSLERRVGTEAIRKQRENEELLSGIKKETPYTIGQTRRGAELHTDDFSFIQDKRGITGDELHHLPGVDLDIEIPFFKYKDRAQISWVGVNYHEKDKTKKVIYTLSDLGKDTYKGYRIKSFASEIDLITGLARDIRLFQPLTISAFNNKFDLTKLGKEGTFKIGHHYAHPVMEATTKFFERLNVKGMIAFDKLRWAQMAYGYLHTKKLDLIGKEALGEEAFSKTITYDEMERLEEKALYAKDRNEREKAGSVIANYLVDDVDVLEDLRTSDKMRWSLDYLCWISERDNIPLQQALFSSRLTHYRQKQDSLKKTNIYEDEMKYLRQGLRQKESQMKQKFNEFLISTSDINARSGLYENVMLMQINYAKAMREELDKRYPNVEGLFKKLEEQGDEPFRREFMTTILNDATDNIKIDMMRLHEEEKQIARMFNKYNLTSDTKKAFKERLFNYGNQYLKARGITDAKSIVASTTGQSIDDESVKGVLRLMNSHRKKKNRYYAMYRTNMETTRFKIMHQLEQAKEILKSYGLRPIHQERSYLYVVGERDRFEKDHPGHFITTFDSVYLAKRFDPENNDEILTDNPYKLYYKRFGFYKGVTIKDHPSHYLNMFEMRTYKGFLHNMFSKDPVQAASHLAAQESRMYNERVDKKDLVMMTKPKKEFGPERYKAFENGQTIYFRTRPSDDEPIHTDTVSRRYYQLETINTKQRPVYIMDTDDLDPDWGMYYEKHRDIIYDLAYYSIGGERLLDLLKTARANDLFKQEAIEKSAQCLENRMF